MPSLDFPHPLRPDWIIRLSEWADLARPLVKRYGPAKVWEVSRDVTVFPALYSLSGLEFLTLKDALEKR